MKVRVQDEFIVRRPLIKLSKEILNNGSLNELDNELLQKAVSVVSKDFHSYINNDSGEYLDVKTYYLLRSSSRPTPLGLFGKVGMGKFHNFNEVEIKHIGDLYIKYDAFDQDNSNYESIVLNPTVFYKEESIYYYSIDKFYYSMKTFQNNELISKILNIFVDPVSKKDVINILREACGISEAAIRNIMGVLLSSNILLIQNNNVYFAHTGKIESSNNISSLHDLGNDAYQFATLSQDIIKIPLNIKKDIEKNIEQLAFISRRTDTAMKDYIEKFKDRYGYTTVRFVDMIDDLSGIGYPGPIEDSKRLNLDHMMREVYDRFVITGSQVIDLNTHSFRALFHSANRNELLNTKIGIDLFVNLAWSNKLNKYMAVIHPTASTSNAGSSGGRYGLLSSQIKQHISKLAKYDQENFSNYKVIDLIYMIPQKTTNNLAAHPKYYQYSFNIFLPSDAENIRIGDIMVSLVDDELVLFDSKDNKPATFRSMSLVNPELAPDFIKLLIRLSEYKNNFEIVFDNELNMSTPVFPRVVFDNIILIPQRWNIKKYNNSSPYAIEDYINERIKTLNIPKIVWLRTRESRLLVNLENSSHLRLVLAEVKRSSIQFNEVYYDSFNNYSVDDYIIPITFHSNTIKEIDIPPIHVQKNFDFGQEWIYFNIYAQDRNFNKILQYLTKDIVDKWFFVRYYDTKLHIRVRFKTNDYFGLLNNLIIRINNIRRMGLIDTYALHCYQPEIARYGGETGMTNAEELFFISSEGYINGISIEKDMAEKVIESLIYQLRSILSNYSQDEYMDILYNILSRHISSRKLHIKKDSFDIIVSRIDHMPIHGINFRFSVLQIESILHMDMNRWGVDGNLESSYIKTAVKCLISHKVRRGYVRKNSS
ncbi:MULTISPECIES: thiopeptide-type bacteriocin biosynthesis protein [unclassified Deinococcus]|uniref:thiopeptide-type bacteriocin biosynthesis protein n=1 Tax=unclassified Deinococcus TaxID=2623546 RepID=UPI001C2F1985|nr:MULTISPECIES: thiopeptide-type bacteriocin biosynthesis protein [unclassified Deinococcus]MDK2014678.1 thiopeptide-type bacteriocin biosynthesis protein [Deinococcus sp. 43]